jgi:hypothetical protein
VKRVLKGCHTVNQTCHYALHFVHMFKDENFLLEQRMMSRASEIEVRSHALIYMCIRIIIHVLYVEYKGRRFCEPVSCIGIHSMGKKYDSPQMV